MLLPFTHDQFIEVFAAYNAAIWPVQVVAALLGLGVCVAVARGGTDSWPVAGAGLAAMWIWTGVAYHGLFFSRINEAAIGFGALFVLQGLLLLLAAVRGRLKFGPRTRRSPWAIAGWALIGYSAVLYPMVNWLTGMAYPGMPTFGVTPCPVTLFTFGVLLLASRPPWWLVPIPFAWALLGGSAALLLRVPADWVLLASAVSAVSLLARARELQSNPTRTNPDIHNSSQLGSVSRHS